MIPEIGKTYRIDYWHQVEPGEDTTNFYRGNAKCVETFSQDTDIDNNPSMVFDFQTPMNILYLPKKI